MTIKIETEEGVIALTKQQFDQALADSRHCRCGDCLICYVREHSDEKTYNFRRSENAGSEN